jgi:hypothetical protein
MRLGVEWAEEEDDETNGREKEEKRSGAREG